MSSSVVVVLQREEGRRAGDGGKEEKARAPDVGDRRVRVTATMVTAIKPWSGVSLTQGSVWAWRVHPDADCMGCVGGRGRLNVQRAHQRRSWKPGNNS